MFLSVIALTVMFVAPHALMRGYGLIMDRERASVRTVVAGILVTMVAVAGAFYLAKALLGREPAALYSLLVYVSWLSQITFNEKLRLCRDIHLMRNRSSLTVSSWLERLS